MPESQPSFEPDVPALADQVSRAVVVPETLLGCADAIRAGELTSVALVEHSLARIERLDDRIGSMVSVYVEAALEAARRADDELSRGRDRGPLHGVPIVVKDLLTTADGPTRANSRVACALSDVRADAVAISQLRQSGSVILGKSTTSEYALGTPDAGSGFAPCRNPWDIHRWPGGSSSGTAAAVAAALAPGGIGTDSGGSIRMPAALCGITGFKPTFGRIGNGGCIPVAPSLDTVGPMARTAADCAAIFDAMSGIDAGSRSLPDLADGDLAGVRVGVLAPEADGTDAKISGVDPALPSLMDAFVLALGECGASAQRVHLEGFANLRTANTTVLFAEAYAEHVNDARRDWAGYGREARDRLALGASYRAADVAGARALARRARRDMTELFGRLDVLIMPTLAFVAPRLDEDFGDQLTRLLFTGPWNLLGLPAISVPIGRGCFGLPLGAQIVGRAGDDADVLRVAHAYQLVSDWHTDTPEQLDPRYGGEDA